MASFQRRITAIVLVLIMVSITSARVTAQTNTLDPKLYKVSTQKLDNYQKRVDDIHAKTIDRGAQDKQLQKVADDVNTEGIKFIEDAGDKLFVSKEHIANIVAEYMSNMIALLGRKRLCPLIGKLVGPGAKYEKTEGALWDEMREIQKKDCQEKPAFAPGRGIKLGGGVPGFNDGPCPKGLHLLEDCVKENNLIVNLYGDGQTTSQCQLVVSDQQGHTASAQIPTVCASRKSLSPPVSKDDAAKQNLTYKVATGANPRALCLVEKAKELDKQGKYNDVPLNPEKRCSTVAQLSIWKDIGGSTPGNKDAITRDSIKTDMLHKAGINPASLTREEKEKLKDRVDKICAAVDLTIKEGTQTKEESQTEEKPTKHPALPSGYNDHSSNMLVAYHPASAQLEAATLSQPLRLAQVQVEKGKCCIPKGTVFVPSNREKYQDMMCVEDQVFDCPPGISDSPISDGCTWYFAKQLTLPKNPYKSRTEGDKYDAFEKDQANRITEEMERLAEIEAEFIDEDEAAHTTDLFKTSTIVLLFICMDKSHHARSVRYKILTEDEAKNWDPSGDLDERKKRKDARKDTIKKYKKDITEGPI